MSTHPEQQDVYGHKGRPELLPFVPRAARTILDVGCAHGNFAADLRSIFGDSAHVTGIEPVDGAGEAARATGLLDDVRIGYFPDTVGAEETFDLIFFNDVLEHVIDPWTMLRQAREHVSPGGHVFASMPNVQNIDVQRGLRKGDWTYVEKGILDRTHLRFFTKKTMVDLFETAGFVVDAIDGINPWKWQFYDQHPKPKQAAVRAIRHLLGDASYLQFAVVGHPAD